MKFSSKIFFAVLFFCATFFALAQRKYGINPFPIPAAGISIQGITSVDLSIKLFGGSVGPSTKPGNKTSSHLDFFSFGVGTSMFQYHKTTYAPLMFNASYVFFPWNRRRALVLGFIFRSQFTFFKINAVKDQRLTAETGIAFGFLSITYGYNFAEGRTVLPMISKNKIGINLMF
jgi:hypothetical protein